MRRFGFGASVMGLDLSLRHAAAVVLPASWKPGTWNFPRTVAGHALEKSASPEDVVRRLETIVDAIVDFAAEHAVLHAFVEDYAYGLAGLGGMRLGELGGAVKVALWSRAFQTVARPVNVMTARKYLLGKLPRSNQAAATMDALKSMGAKFESTDEADAFVIANYGRSELGLPGLSLST